MLARRLTRLLVVALLVSAIAPLPAAHAGAPPPLSNPLYGFPLPGDYVSPAAAASAGLSLADRWLGESVFENPAATVSQGIQVSGVFQRLSRQDLAAKNRNIDQTQGYLDGAGVALSLPTKRWGFSVYAWQPVLRLEQQGYITGPQLTPSAVEQQALQREIRAGAALSRSMGEVVRVGVAGEWVHRDDSYEAHNKSGPLSPEDNVLQFKGEAWGGSMGFSWAKDPDRPWGTWFGAAIHYGAELKVTSSLDSRSLDTTIVAAIEGTREAEWTGGVSGRVTVAPATRVVVGVSVRTGADWKGFDFGTGTGAGYAIGLDWKDPELPWGARFGVGQETDPGAIERKAGLLSAGFSWVSGDLVIDVGILHRNLARAGSPSSSDDRAVASVKVAF